MAQTRIISALQVATLPEDITLADGSNLAKGSQVVLVPQTLAQAVLVENSTTLAEVWPQISRAGHGHADMNLVLADCQKEVIRLSDRLTAFELAQNQGEENA